MSTSRQVGKRLYKSAVETAHNERRVAENFPQVERAVDSVSSVFPFDMNFVTSDHPHTAKMMIKIKTAEVPCEIEEVPYYAQCGTGCSNFYGGSWVSGIPATYDRFRSNIGGFGLGSPYGIIVPITGYYNIRFTNDVVGVCTAESQFVVGGIQHNGIPILTQTYTPGAGFAHPLAFLACWVDITATGVFCAAGDNVGGWLAQSGDIPFFTPSDFCWIFGDLAGFDVQATYITLVGT